MSRSPASRCLTAAIVLVIGLFVAAAAHADEPAKPARRGAAAIERALAEPTELEFIETPLGDAMAYLSDRHGIDIHFDLLAMESAGVTQETLITSNLRGITLRSALQLLLEPLDMTWTARNDTLLVTTSDAARREAVQRVYDVSGLIGQADDEAFDAAAIADLAQSVVEATASGSEVGTIRPAGQAIAVTHSRSAHESISRLLADLRSLTANAQVPDTQITAAEAKVAKALHSSTEIEFQDTPLLDIIEYLKDRHAIQIVIDNAGLEDAGVSSDAPITFKAEGIALADALDLMLANVQQLDWRIWNESLQITSREVTGSTVGLRVYAIADLVARGHAPEALVDAVTSVPEALEQGSWDDGDVGMIQAVPGGLVVCQTDRAHREIAALFAELRKLPPPVDGADADPFRFQIYVVRGVAPAELVQPIQLMVAPGAWGGAADPGSIVAVAGLAAPESAAAEEPEATDDAPKPKFEELLNGLSDLGKLVGNQPAAPHSGWLLIRQRASIQRRIEKLLDRMDVLVEVK